MGLYMYLTAKRYFSSSEPAIKLEPNPIPEGFELTTITCEVAYWRKANQIHAWFVNNVQGGVDECVEHFVSEEQLNELRDLCKKVVADPKLAEEKLPAQSGVFFGSTEYNEWYFADLRETINMIEKALVAFSHDEWDFYYQSSW